MSQDIRLTWPCPHFVAEELVSLDETRQSVSTQFPISSKSSVRVSIGDSADTFRYIPSTGLWSHAKIIAENSGPYDVVPDKGCRTAPLVVSTSSEHIHLDLPAGRYTAAQIAGRAGSVAFVTEQGYLAFEDKAKAGPESFVKVEKSPISFMQRMVIGKQVYPGWAVVEESSIRFSQPLKRNSTIRVSYPVESHNCLRCKATRIENDYRFDVQGNVAMVENENLLYQAAMKILLTIQGSNPFHTWYGTSIMTRIGTKAVSTVAGTISEEVRKAIMNLQKAQIEQSQFQQVSSRERVYALLGCTVLQHNTDPTLFLVDVTVQNASGKPVELSVVYNAPGSYHIE